MKYFISVIAFIITLLSAAWMLVFQESGQKAAFAQPAGVGAFLEVPQRHPAAGKETLSMWFESLAENLIHPYLLEALCCPKRAGVSIAVHVSIGA